MNISANSIARFAKEAHHRTERVRAEHLLIAGSDVAAPILNALPEPAALLNEDKHLVYANFAFLEAAGIDSNEALLGLCVGELFGCVHAADAMASDGEHAACQQCSVKNSPVASLNSKHTVSAVAIKVTEGDGESEIRFQHSMPVVIRGRCYSLIRIEPA